MTKFIVGDFFNQENLQKILMPHGVVVGKLFEEKLIIPNAKREILINENIGKLRIINIIETMNDSQAQEYAESAPLEEEELFQILYLLVGDYNGGSGNRKCLEVLGTKYYYNHGYHFNVKLGSGELLSVWLSLFGPFYFVAERFDNGVFTGMFCFIKSKFI